MTIKPVDIRRAAMDLLARREHGFDELSQKLQKRFTRKKPTKKPTKKNHTDDADFDGDDIAPNELEFEPTLESPNCCADSQILAIPTSSLPELIYDAVERLKNQGLQSDERMAEAFVRARSNRGQGPIKIKAELRQKGINDELVSIAIRHCQVDWYELAKTVSLRRFPSCPDYAMKAKRSRFLQQRGFSFDHIAALD